MAAAATLGAAPVALRVRGRGVAIELEPGGRAVTIEVSAPTRRQGADDVAAGAALQGALFGTDQEPRVVTDLNPHQVVIGFDVDGDLARGLAHGVADDLARQEARLFRDLVA